MSEARLAWVLRTIMVVAAAAILYLLGQSEVPLAPVVKVILNVVLVALAALNPGTVASKLPTKS